jgi:hypothetical protein
MKTQRREWESAGRRRKRRYNLDKQLRIVRRRAKGKNPEAFVELCNQYMAGKNG